MVKKELRDSASFSAGPRRKQIGGIEVGEDAQAAPSCKWIVYRMAKLPPASVVTPANSEECRTRARKPPCYRPTYPRDDRLDDIVLDLLEVECFTLSKAPLPKRLQAVPRKLNVNRRNDD